MNGQRRPGKQVAEVPFSWPGGVLRKARIPLVYGIGKIVQLMREVVPAEGHGAKERARFPDSIARERQGLGEPRRHTYIHTLLYGVKAVGSNTSTVNVRF